MRKQQIIRRKIWKKSKKLVSIEAPDLWKTFEDGVLKVCDEMCGKKKCRGDRDDMWW